MTNINAKVQNDERVTIK